GVDDVGRRGVRRVADGGAGVRDSSRVARGAAGSRGMSSIRVMTMRTFRSVLGLLLATVVSGTTVAAQQRLTLADAVAIAERQSFTSRAAMSTRTAARARDRAFAANLMPQVSLSGNLPVFNRSIIPVLQPDGSTLFRPQQQNES